MKSEKGITITALAITLVLITIITSISIVMGNDTIDSTKFTAIQTELAVVQAKVNEMTVYYEDNLLVPELTDENKSVLETTEVSNELLKKAHDSGRTIEDIKKGFKLFTPDSIKQVFGLENITEEYLINIEDCIVILANVFEYEGVNYYMQEQMSIGLYNVTYNNQISPTGTFSVTTSKITDDSGITDKYQINISTNHKYVSKWQVKYKLESDTNWKTTNNTTFTVATSGTYEIQVTHGDEIILTPDSGSSLITINP